MTRYDTDRALGYRDEAVWQRDKRHVSMMAEAAEDWMARYLGLPGGQGDLGHADPGWDFVYRGRRVDVKWTQTLPDVRGKWPYYPGLIIPTWKPKALRADVYALVMGLAIEEFDKWAWADGWATNAEVRAAKVLDIGRQRETSGKPAPFHFIGFDYLRPLETLETL